MHAATYDELTQKIYNKSDKITNICQSVRDSMSLISVFSSILHVMYLSWRLLNDLDKIENKYCPKCDGEECDHIIKTEESLTKVLGSMRSLRKIQDKLKFPAFIVKKQDRIIERFEDKVENYSIASDKEIKELTSAVVGKINRHHAA